MIDRTSDVASRATLDFCGECYVAEAGSSLRIGRDGDVMIDDNPYLHRHFLDLSHRQDLWWLTNVGSQLAATVADASGAMQAWLAPKGIDAPGLRRDRGLVHRRSDHL